MANIDKRIDEIERRLSNTIRRQESTQEDRLTWFAFDLYQKGLYYLKDYLPRENQTHVHNFLSSLHQKIYWPGYRDIEIPTVPQESQDRIFEISFACGYSYLKAASILFDGDPSLAARAADLRLMDQPDLSRTYFTYSQYAESVDDDPDWPTWNYQERTWQDVLKWYQDHGFGCFGPRSDFESGSHGLSSVMSSERIYRENVSLWIYTYGRSVVGSIIDTEKINGLDHHISKLKEENKQRSILETGE